MKRLSNEEKELLIELLERLFEQADGAERISIINVINAVKK